MNYYAELMKKAEELGLRIHQSRYDDHLRRMSVHETIVYEPGTAPHNVIARIKQYNSYDFQHETEQAVYKAYKAILDYESWK